METYWADFIDKQLTRNRWYLAHVSIQQVLEDFFEYLVQENVIPKEEITEEEYQRRKNNESKN